jgi:enediyne biosynthesis protein E4
VTRGFVTQGAVSADVNHDGLRDLFITTIATTDSTQVIPRAHNLLFLNKGNRKFEDVTTEYNLESLNSFSTGPSFGDVNADGYPDLYVGNYFLEFQGKLDVLKDATIASSHQTAKGYLLINKGGSSFKNEYGDYGLTHRGFGFGALFTDFDNDGDQDLLVNQDFGYKAVPSFLYENLFPRSLFKDISKSVGMDLKINAMGSAVGDFDNNGLLDYYVTNMRFNHFMIRKGVGLPFLNLSKERGTFQLGISWGANFADFDNDMDLDLYVANGDLNPNCTPMANFYFENVHGMFTEKAGIMGVNDYGIGRGSVVFDMDKDGDLDLLVVNQQPVQEYPIPSETRLFRNDAPKGNWLQVALIGIQAESNGIGSRVEVITGKTRMLREIDGGGSSHLSQNSCIAHFGLGTASKADSVIVTWAGGRRQVLVAQQANQLLHITEITDDKSYSWIVAGVLTLIFPVGVWFLLKRRDSRHRKMNP